MSDKGRPLPKFGEWDVNDPASAEGFTVIFNKARDEKKTGGKPESPSKADQSNVRPGVDPGRPSYVDDPWLSEKMVLLHGPTTHTILTRSPTCKCLQQKSMLFCNWLHHIFPKKIGSCIAVMDLFVWRKTL
ncbi:hypothetical protein ACLB2K_021379 [Fragaria x ananassa]